MATKILVIEDEKDIRDTITYALEEYQYEVVSSEDAGILKLLDEIKPDLIMLDNWLTEWTSDANGQQISRELKNDPKTAHIPIILISAMSNVKELATAGQADAYLQKPFDLTDLVDIVNRFAAPPVR
ncbi:twitching motility two-component system response regulator PilG [Mucilaginibacter yixingensis]|uniref:Twitching motility two-component system response regulator PilG n=1 Tax=Mucilaginibacter yixingensis TaxID=1295612 RepID=A0A2T5JBU8_9SPHI|nr:response regulator [Mucilaginibacter yixingensis]PTQ99228.1 twitching motility two-component system response regulator PilG [Mucilaginibacter yixingensis]